MKPVLQALVLAENIQELKDGRKVIFGTFDSIIIDKKPIIGKKKNDDGTTITTARGHSGSPYVYISLTDVCDDTTLHLQFVSLKQNAVLAHNSIVIKCNDRLRTIEIVSHLPPLPVSEPGIYSFDVVCENDVIGSQRITVKEQSES